MSDERRERIQELKARVQARQKTEEDKQWQQKVLAAQEEVAALLASLQSVHFLGHHSFEEKIHEPEILYMHVGL
jgi:hypothetical protein